jgi:hypothetical protein
VIVSIPVTNNRSTFGLLAWVNNWVVFGPAECALERGSSAAVGGRILGTTPLRSKTSYAGASTH